MGERPLRALALLSALNDGGSITWSSVASRRLRMARRATRDLDIVVEPGNANLVRLGRVLGTLHAERVMSDGERRPVEDQDLASVALGATLHGMTAAGALDVVGDPAGAPPYPDLRARAVTVHAEGVDGHR